MENGGDKTKPVESSSASRPSPFFRKSTSFDSPGSDAERPQSQQSGRSAGPNKKKSIPSFFSSFFGNNKAPKNEQQGVEPTATPITSAPTPVAPTAASATSAKSISGKNSTSHESINSVQSTSSFSFVNPTKYGGKRVKGKRIPVDDPNYGSTTKATDGKRSFGNTLDKIGIKMGLKKKYNLQSCESLQYIDSCDEPLPIVAGTPSAVAAAAVISSPSGSAQIQDATSQGQPPYSRVEDKESRRKTSVGQGETPKNESALVNAEFSANCLARAKHNVGQPKQTNKVESNSTTQPEEQPSKSNANDAKPRKSFSESSAQTVITPVKEQVSSAALAEPKPLQNSKPVPQTAPVKEMLVKPSNSKVEATTNTEVMKEIKKPEVAIKSTTAVTESKLTEPTVTATTFIMESKKPEVARKFTTELDATKKSEVKAAFVIEPAEIKNSKVEVPSTPVVVGAAKLEVKAPSSPVAAESSKPEVKVSSTPLVTGASKPEMKATSMAMTVAAEGPKPEVKAPFTAVPSEASEPIAKADDQKPCSSRSITDRMSPPPQVPSTSSSASTSSSFMQPGSSNTWSNSNRRKRRAPQPPSNDNCSSQKFTNGTTELTTSMVVDAPNDVPSPSSRAAVLTRFTRIEESPPPSNPFEIRPRKKERSLEPMPVTRPSSSFATPSSNTLFSRRAQQHKRSCSEGYSTNSQGRVHKPGKKKAPAPPNPFGNPDGSRKSRGVEVEYNPFLDPLDLEPSTNNEERSTPSSSNVTVAPTPTLTLTSLPPAMPKSSEKLPLSQPSTSSSSIKTSTVITAARFQQGSISHSATAPTSRSNSSELSPPATASSSSSLPSTSASTSFTTSPTPLTSTITFTSTTVTPTFIQPLPILEEPNQEVLDEIRQNMLNDEHERQQLGLLQQNNDASPQAASSSISATLTTVPSEPTPSEQNETARPRPTSDVPVISTSSATSTISEADIQSAQRALATLSASVQSSSAPKKEDPKVKAKLVELKKEADKSSLNPPKSKSRPASIGSSIYESPLAILIGRSSNSSNSASNGNNNEAPEASNMSSAESILASKPWYKRGGSSVLSIKPFMSSKTKQPTPIKPFSSLVKFSELDKEATRIVEENRRKSAEQRVHESDQEELDEMFSSTIAAGTVDPGARESGERNQRTTPSIASNPNRVFTTAQVHLPITEEADGPTEASSAPTATAVAASASNSFTVTNNGSSSPPTFQSVHAASKHRQIKPLLGSSPITHVRSEKLAIVQPQASIVTAKATSPATSLSISTSSTPASSIVSSPLTASTTASTLASTQSPTMTTTVTSTHGEPDWDCTRCTLKNPSWRILCEICFQRKDSAPCGSYFSSILQRVNSEVNSNKPVTTSSSPQVTTTSSVVTSSSSSLSISVPSGRVISLPKSTSSPTSTTSSNPSVITSTKSTTSTTNSISSSHCIPSVVEQFKPPSANPGVSTSQNACEASSNSNSNAAPPKIAKSTSNGNKKPDIPLPPSSSSPLPSCENFLSQLPAKQDQAKEGKLQGMKLHEDPELEELDISKLREVRLAYFQRRESSDVSTNSASATPPPISSDETELQQQPNDFSNYNADNGHKNTTQVSTPSSQIKEPPTTAFSDNEDDFIDSMLQLDATVANISDTGAGLLPCSPCKPTSSPSPTMLQNRYKPRLEAIREGSSQDYTYCYSSSEIAQIYENWQANGNHAGGGGSSASNKTFAGLPIPSGIVLEPQQETHLLDQNHWQGKPLVFTGNNIQPDPQQCSGSHPISLVMPPVDHQPYANNRMADSPEENYVNATTTPTHPTALLNEMGRFSCSSPLPQLCLSSLGMVPGYLHGSCGPSGVIDNNSIAAPINQVQNPLSESKNNNTGNYENGNMSLNQGGSSSRFSYEEYRRMGAIPKGFPLNSRQNEEWSSNESSCDTDSSRGLWGRGGVGGYQDSLPGSIRRGTLEFSQPLDSSTFPDPSFAVGKLMKRLEAAIAHGDHRLAATLAHDLALMKVHCVVAKINQPYSIRVYVEDRFMQQGPFLVQVSSMMTVRDLKAKIESDWGIPAQFQKWILGQKMAEDESHSLSSFEMTQDAMAFLFLVTPDIGNSHSGTVARDSKPSNQASCLPSVSDLLSASTSFAINAAAGLNAMSESRSHARKSISPARNVPCVPTGHTYDVISEGGMQHLYNNLDKIKPANQSDKKVAEQKPTASSSKKTSSAAQTASSSIGNQIKESTPPPPLPSRSPIPGTSSKMPPEPRPKKVIDSPTKVKEEKITNSTQNPSAKPATTTVISKQQQPSIRKESGESQQQQKSPSTMNGESPSIAATLTLSLQQKLADFKAMAEQTLGNAKSGITVLSRSSSKERSPAPAFPSTSKAGASRVTNSEASSKKAENREGRPVSRKVGKSVRNSSKERLVTTSAPGSIEKLSASKDESPREKGRASRPNVPENRFNGILLPSPDTSGNLEPPKRLDKAKKNATRVASPDKGTRGDVNENSQKQRDSGIHTKPPLPQQVQPKKEASPAVTAAPPTLTENCEISKFENLHEEATVSAAPQPKPRILRKQQSTPEKATVTDETPTKPSEDISQCAPVPTPRTFTSTGIKSDPRVSSPLEKKEDNSPSPAPQPVQVAAVAATPQSPQQQAKVEEFCQTTLPFPAPKQNKPDMASSSNAQEPTAFLGSQFNTSFLTGSNCPSANVGLLRPSAFVSQNYSCPPTSGTSVLLPILTTHFTSTTTTTSTSSETSSSKANVSSPIAVAHVQPLHITPKHSTTPTAYVAPSPSSSSSTTSQHQHQKPNSDGGEHGKKKDDSAQSYLKMLEIMEKQDLISTTEDAECPVCFTSIPKGEGVVLRDCLHTFCRECLVGCVQYADESTVKCPFRDNSYACNYNLQEREIKALVPSEVFEKYLARSVKLAENQTLNSYHCKTPDCTGWCVFEDDVNVFLCPVCKKRNCITCAAIHDGMDCQKYQRELAIAAETDEDAKQSRLMLEKMIQRGEALDCPACHVVLLKKWGCDWVRCSYCKTEICWVTKGFRWGKGGKGDVSGGCKCGVNGVKCHPKCTYCH